MKKPAKQNNQSFRSQKQTEHNKRNNKSNMEQSKPKGSQQNQNKNNQIKKNQIKSFNKILSGNQGNSQLIKIRTSTSNNERRTTALIANNKIKIYHYMFIYFYCLNSYFTSRRLDSPSFYQRCNDLIAAQLMQQLVDSHSVNNRKLQINLGARVVTLTSQSYCLYFVRADIDAIYSNRNQILLKFQQLFMHQNYIELFATECYNYDLCFNSTLHFFIYYLIKQPRIFSKKKFRCERYLLKQCITAHIIILFNIITDTMELFNQGSY
ncbi:Hypothetical_protein [Hexamita inflata]|uniref:Hypothetical_protein n=1 Tax=Hexamita inflata TaxID=28002 RepID=A0AA86NU82_9EUKA|nr:Hypothetical protein HINF_LOCUS13678 [Hexamita inflata]